MLVIIILLLPDWRNPVTAASATRSVTPHDLTITPRDRKFVRDARPARWWNGGDPVATALYNALSATFPEGEAFFVESVHRYRDGAPPRLAKEIQAFTTQEAIHSREHAVFNKAATEAGYDLTRLEQRVHWRLGLVRERPPIAALAATMAESAALWKWHAAEEIEHKGVAYDTWLFATRDWPVSKRWKVKAKVMLLVTRNFIVDRTLGSLELLRQDGITGPRAWAGLLWYMWVRPGMMRKIFSAWAKYFLPGFHPWNEDDRHLIAGFDLAGDYGQAPAKSVRGAKTA
jgi:predicted metal-dependent hydrolase